MLCSAAQYVKLKKNFDDSFNQLFNFIMDSSTDEDTVFLILNERRRKKINRRYWVHPLNLLRPTMGEHLKIEKMYSSYPQKFFEYTRLIPSLFDKLLIMIEPRITKQDTNWRESIPARTRLFVTLRFLATGDSIGTIATNFSIGKSTASLIINETLPVLWEVLAPTFVRVPSEDEWIQIINDFESHWNFPNCLGAIDGKHVVVQAPPKSGSLFHNYKGSFSIVLLATCDAQYCFTTIDVGAYGRQSDGGIFSNSILRKGLLSGSFGIPGDRQIKDSYLVQPCTFVGDEAFSLSTFMMRPYPGKQTSINKKRIFNYRLSRARRIIENAFGILATRFRIYRRSIIAHPDCVCNIIKATVALHNFIRKEEDSLSPDKRMYCPLGYVDTEDQPNGGWRQNTSETSALRDIGKSGSNMYSKNAKQMRDNLAEFFITENGRVPWQNERAVLLAE